MKRTKKFVLRLVLFLLPVLLLLLLPGPMAGEAAVQVQRPIMVSGGKVNQTYLWAEETTTNSGQVITHRGLDFSYPAVYGTEVFAVADGWISDLKDAYQDNDNSSIWGNFVLLEHKEKQYDLDSGSMSKVYSMYLHLAQDSIPAGLDKGDSISAGQLIGRVDNTGSGSFGSHLHLQIVLHPQSNRTLEPFTLDSENRSRNPEMWLEPYGTMTARAVGKVTDANGNPLSNVVICGMQKPYGSYGWSRTYSYPWANPDDYLVENFSTTDIQPGTYHLYAYPYQGPDVNTCANPPGLIEDLGQHTFVAGHTTYIGLYPVFLPDLRSGFYAGNSKIVIRNNGGKTARVYTTIFKGGYNDVHQRLSHNLGPKKILEIDPTGDLDHASALIVASQDISVMVRQELSGSVYASYLGISDPAPQIFVPLVHRKNSGWSSQLHIQNAGYKKTEVTIEFKPWNGLGKYCTMNKSVNPYLTERIDLNFVGENCLTNPKEPVFVGSATISSGNNQPLAVTYPQQKRSGSAIVALMESSKNGALSNIAYAPLIQNYNSNYQVVSGIASQNTNTAANSIQRRFRKNFGSICAAWITGVAGRHSIIDVLPPGQSGGCSPVLSARIKNLNSLGISATVNQFWLNQYSYPNYWTDYPAISTPAKTVIVPWWYDQNGWDSALVIRNAGGSMASGNVKFFYANGLLAGSPVPFSIYGNGYTIIDAPVGGLKGSAKVTSSQNVAVIVNHFNPNSGGDKIMSNAGDHKP